jgi:hypothetical protein
MISCPSRQNFLGLKRPGLCVNHPFQFSAEVKERIELYLYSSLRAFMACCRANFTLPFTCIVLSQREVLVSLVNVSLKRNGSVLRHFIDAFSSVFIHFAVHSQLPRQNRRKFTECLLMYSSFMTTLHRNLVCMLKLKALPLISRCFYTLEGWIHQFIIINDLSFRR